MKGLLTGRFEQNRKLWLVASSILFIVMGVLPYDTRIAYKVGYICLFTVWGDFLARPGDGDFLSILTVTAIWIFVSALLGWLAGALICLVRALCAAGANAQLGASAHGGPAQRRARIVRGQIGGPPSVS